MLISRRTLAAFAAVAALTGGVSGGVVSSVTTPDSAAAAGTNYIERIGKFKPADERTSRITLAEVRNIAATTADTNARVRAIESRVGSVDAKVDALAGMTARGADGRTLINLVQTILANQEDD